MLGWSRRATLIGCFGLLGPTATFWAEASTAPAEVVAALPGARLQGESRLRYFGLRIYDARLWAGASPVEAEWASVPFALEMEYARHLKGVQIAERSLTEMKRQGDLPPETEQRWLATLKQWLPDVKDGDRITGVNIPGQGLKLYLNGAPRAESSDAELSKVFFGIWLSPRTSEPAMRQALLGRAKP
jgi:hypothetical protein